MLATEVLKVVRWQRFLRDAATHRPCAVCFRYGDLLRNLCGAAGGGRGEARGEQQRRRVRCDCRHHQAAVVAAVGRRVLTQRLHGREMPALHGSHVKPLLQFLIFLPQRVTAERLIDCRVLLRMASEPVGQV